MSEDTKVAIEALRQAMLNEEETRDFYREAVGRTTNDKARQMFEELADEEVLHMKIIHEQYESIRAGEGWTAVADFDDLEDVDISPLEMGRAELGTSVNDSTTDLEALTIAAEMENRSFAFYTEQYNRTTDPVGKRVYGGLVNAERNHFNRIMSNWEYLVNTGAR